MSTAKPTRAGDPVRLSLQAKNYDDSKFVRAFIKDHT